jgi:hypothetical protein
MLKVHIAGAMRVVEGQVQMGMFDLADASFAPKVEALLSDLGQHLGNNRGPSGLVVPWAPDVVIARA